MDTLSAKDLETYSHLLDRLPFRERTCGFVSGEEELLCWEPSDLFQFYHDTVWLFGSFEGVWSRISLQDVRRAVWVGACNIYHLCAHNFVHEKSVQQLKEGYKSAVFTLQAIAFLKTGRYEKSRKGLFPVLQSRDLDVLKAREQLQGKTHLSSDEWMEYSQLLLDWASGWIKRSAFENEKGGKEYGKIRKDPSGEFGPDFA